MLVDFDHRSMVLVLPQPAGSKATVSAVPDLPAVMAMLATEDLVPLAMATLAVAKARPPIATMSVSLVALLQPLPCAARQTTEMLPMPSVTAATDEKASLVSTLCLIPCYATARLVLLGA